MRHFPESRSLFCERVRSSNARGNAHRFEQTPVDFHSELECDHELGLDPHGLRRSGATRQDCLEDRVWQP